MIEPRTDLAIGVFEQESWMLRITPKPSIRDGPS
jgi:hypothetical protein